MRITKSPLKTKKWRAIFEDGDHTDFGDPMYESYVEHHDVERRRRYKIRHEKDLDSRNPKSAGFLSYFLLWGDSTSLDENIKAYKRKFGNL